LPFHFRQQLSRVFTGIFLECWQQGNEMASVATGEAESHSLCQGCYDILRIALWTGRGCFWLDFCVGTLSPDGRWQTVGNSEETRNYLMGNLKPDEVGPMGQLHIPYDS